MVRSKEQNKKLKKRWFFNDNKSTFFSSRLTSGVGTRAQICELLKESQYINENISDEKVK